MRGRISARQGYQSSVLLLFLVVLALACHPWDKHIDSVHSLGDWEDVCLDLHGLPPEALGLYADDWDRRLWDNNSPTNWDKPYNLAFFVHRDSECPGRPSDEIHIHMYSEGNGPCRDDVTACVIPDEDSNSGHNYAKMEIHTAPLSTRVANHEIGHTLGFDDPTGRSDRSINQRVSQNYDTCRIRLSSGVVAPVWSIMHTGYCAPEVPFSIQYPTIFDLASFDANVAP